MSGGEAFVRCPDHQFVVECLVRLSKPAKSLNVNILSYKKDENLENNVKCGEIIIFEHRIIKITKFPLDFVSAMGFCQKRFPIGGAFEVSRGQPSWGWLPVKVIPALKI